MLALDPGNASTLYAGTSGGVYKSTDDGASWVASNNGLPGLRDARGLVIDPTNPSTLYAGTDFEGMFKSTDGAANWVEINNGLTSTFVRGLAIDPGNTSTLYAATSGGGVFKSSDGGANWEAVNNGLTNPFLRAVAIDPGNPSTLYAGSESSQGLFKSSDGGANWVLINNGLTASSVYTLAIDPEDASTLYAGTGGGGMFKSTNMGANWVAINRGLTSTNVESLALDPNNPSTVYAGTSGGGAFKSSDKGANWVEINDGLTNNTVRGLAIDPVNTSTLYAGTGGRGVYKSTDGGASWVEINSGLANGSVLALLLDPGNTSTLYTGTIDGLFKSTDGGGTWEGINTGLTNTRVEALAIDPANTSTLYAGTGGGGAFKSSDGGTNWEGINSGLTTSFFGALIIDPGNPSTLYAGSQGQGVFRSTDMGANWQAINSGLTSTGINALAIDPTNTSTLYAGTFGGGAFLSMERPSWLYAAGNPLGAEAQFDGLALTNFSDTPDTADLEAVLSRSGVASVQTQNPLGNGNQATVVLEAGQQTALLRTDLFEGDPDEPAWIELTSDTGEIGTFFQFGTGTLSQLDGGVAVTQTSTHIAFTRVFDGSEAFRGQPVTTRVSILNPNVDPVTIELHYRPLPNGPSSQGSSTITRTIEGRSFLDERAADLFGLNSSGGPIGDQLLGGVMAGEVTEGDGVVAFEVIQLTDQSTVLGLNAATGNSTNRAYSAQLASQPGLLFTSVNVVNLADAPRNVTLRAVQADGSDQGAPVAIVLNPGEQFTGDAGVLFGGAAAGSQPAGGESFVGSLIVETDGDGVVGDVIFGDSVDFAYAASLPLQTQPFNEALFNQVANVSGFFTGLAFFYPGPDAGGSPQGPEPDAEITIQVFRPGGELVGESIVTLAVGERISQLVEELVGEIELSGGYVRILSTQEIIGQMLFGVIGPGGIQLFSAVPPTVVR